MPSSNVDATAVAIRRCAAAAVWRSARRPSVRYSSGVAAQNASRPPGRSTRRDLGRPVRPGRRSSSRRGRRTRCRRDASRPRRRSLADVAHAAERGRRPAAAMPRRGASSPRLVEADWVATGAGRRAIDHCARVAAGLQASRRRVTDPRRGRLRASRQAARTRMWAVGCARRRRPWYVVGVGDPRHRDSAHARRRHGCSRTVAGQAAIRARARQHAAVRLVEQLAVVERAVAAHRGRAATIAVVAADRRARHGLSGQPAPVTAGRRLREHAACRRDRARNARSSSDAVAVQRGHRCPRGDASACRRRSSAVPARRRVVSAVGVRLQIDSRSAATGPPSREHVVRSSGASRAPARSTRSLESSRRAQP